MNMNYSDEFHDQILEYALGTMPESEIATFESRIQKTPEIRDQIFELQRLHQVVLESMLAPRNTPDFSRQILERIRPVNTSTSRPRLYYLARIGWIAACLLLCFLTFMTFHLSNRINSQLQISQNLDTASLMSTVSSNRVSLGSNETQLIISSLHSPNSKSQSSNPEDRRENQLIQLTVVSESIWQLVDFEANSQETPSPAPIGYIMMDAENKCGYLAVGDLKSTRENLLHIWLKLHGQRDPVFAGILPELQGNKGLLYFDFTTALENKQNGVIEQVFLTEESSVNKVTPKGPVVLRNS